MKKQNKNSRKKQTRKYRKQQRKTKKQCGCLKWNLNWNKIKGGEYGQVPSYALNTWQSDPNYAQISARNMVGGNFLANFGLIDSQAAANTLLGNPPAVDGSPNIQPLINKYYAV